MSIWDQLDTTGVRDSRVEAKERYEEEKRRQQEAARQQAETKRQKEEKRQARTKDPLAPVKDVLRPAAEGLESVVQGAREGIIEATGGNKEEFRRRQQEGRRQLQEADRALREQSKEGIGSLPAEVVRIGASAAGRVAGGIVDTTSLIGDTVVTGLRTVAGQKVDPKDNPFSAEYAAAQTDFGIQQPNTPVGRLARDLMAFGLTAVATARRLPQAALTLGTKGGMATAVASGIIPGAVADFLLSRPDDKNLSTLVEQMIPEQYRDTFLFALAADEEDNPWVVRIKALLEGGGLGAAADSFLWFVRGRFVALARLREGATREEALQAGLEASVNRKTELETQRLENAQRETVRWSEAQEVEMRKLNMEEADFERSIEEARQNGIPNDDPTLKNMEDELARIKLSKIQLEQEVVSGYRPDGEGRLPQEAAASMSQGDVNKAFVQQELLKMGPLPRAVRRPGVSETASIGNQPAFGGSERILTDANYRLMNMDETTEMVVRDIEQRVDIQEIARSLKTTDDAVVEGSGRLVEDIMGVFRDTDGDPPDIVELLRERGATQLITNEAGTEATRILTREGVVAMKTLIAQTAEDIYQLSLNADAMRAAREIDGNQFDRMLDRLESMVTLVKVTGNKFGGGLRSFGLTDADLAGRAGIETDVESLLSVKQVKERVDKIRNLKRIGSDEADAEIQALTRAMALAGGDPTKTVKYGRLVLSLGAEQAMNTMYNSMFSGPVSFLRNALGTSYSVVERPTSLLLRGIAGDEISYRTAFAGYKAMQESVFEAWNVAWTSFKSGDSVNSNSKFLVEDFETQAILQRMEMVARTPSEQMAVGWVKALYNFNHNPWFSWPTRSLTAADDFFKTLVARQQIKMEATAAALSDPRFAGNFDQGLDSYLREFSKKMDPTTGRILDQDLLNIAEKATFQEDPGPMIGYLTKFLDEMPLGRVLVPILRTPANLLRYGGTHLPGINLFIKEARQALMNEATTPAARILKAQYEGRMAIGAMAVAAPAIWAFNDNLTGNGPAPSSKDKNSFRGAWLKTHQPMSIRVGNQWVSYAGFEPLSSIMSMAADVVMLAKMGSTDAAERIGGQLTFSIAAALTEKSFLAGLSTISDLLDPQRASTEKFERSIYNTLNNFIPMAGARRALYNALRPYQMEVDGELQRALNIASGGLVIQGATKVDPLNGQEVPSFAGNFYNAVSPVRIMPADNDPVKKMLSDIQFKIPRNTTGLGGVELTAKDRNELTRTMYELGLRERLEAVMNEPSFKESAEAHRGRTFDPNNPEQMPPHYRSVWAVWNGVRNNALLQMSRTNMDFRQRTLDTKNLNRAARGGRYDAVQQILNSAK